MRRGMQAVADSCRIRYAHSRRLPELDVSLRAVRQASSRVAQDQSQDDDEGQEVRRHPPPPSRALPPRRCWSVLRRCDRACKVIRVFKTHILPGYASATVIL